MSRFTDWQSKLANVIKARQRDAFEWGRNDCCLFAADAIQAMTGNDPAGPWRGKYNTRLEGHRIIKEYGGGDLEAAIVKIAETNNYPEVMPAFARRGDIGLYHDREGVAVGVCVGGQFAYLTEQGLRYVRLSQVSRVWSV